MVGAAEISITVAQALMATRVYVAGWVGRGDMELHLVHGQTEIASDGMTMDPAAWHDWLDAIEAVVGPEAGSPPHELS